MDKLREQLKNPVIAGAAGLVIGLIIGLVVLGWGLFPVQWTDASPAFLREDLKVDYLAMTIESFGKNQDRSLAIARYESLGAGAEQVLSNLQANPGTVAQADILSFTTLVTGAATLPETMVTPVVPATTTEPVRKSVLPAALGIMCGLTVLIAGGLGFVFISRNRRMRGEPGTPAAPEEEDQPTTPVRVSAPVGEQPVAQFMTTYMSGDDLYDDSFSIDSPSGEFLGECGAGISDTIGVGDPKKVAAFEVWLFDKNDIQTVTKVLMSHHAFDDPTIYQRLESKGEPVLAEPGKRILL